MHLGAIAAHGDDLPVGVQLFFEGEEEAGSEALPEILEKYSHLITPDVIVIGDGGVWQTDVPCLLYSLRGIAAVNIELRTLGAAVHSGQYGGTYPDALMALSRLLATLHDDDGSVAVPGLVDEDLPNAIEYPVDLLDEEVRPVDGLEMIGKGSIASRLWSRPAISVLAIDAPPVAEAINQLVPVARARVSMRIPPGQDGRDALEKLKAHLLANVPWGARLTFEHEDIGEATTLPMDNYAVDAWREAFREAFGNEAVDIGAAGRSRSSPPSGPLRERRSW